jgi:hypothetical protein
MVEVNEGRNGVTSWIKAMQVITPLQHFKLINGCTNDRANFMFRNFVSRVSGCYVGDLQ